MGWGERLIAWYLELPPSPPGTTARWSVEFESPLATLFARPLGWTILAALLAACVLLYRRESARLPRAWQALLIGLRVLALAWATLALLGATVRVDRTGRPTLAVMIDTSASMGFADRYETEQVAPSVRPLLGESTRELPRIAILQRFLNADGCRLDRWAGAFQLRVYTFAEEALAAGPSVSPSSGGGVDDGASAPHAGDAADLPPEKASARWAQWIESLEATGRATRLATATRSVVDELRGLPVSALVILTDGIAAPPDGEQLSAAAVVCRDQAIPLFIGGIGTRQPTKDVQLLDLRGEDFAFLGDPVLLTATLRAPGFEGRTIDVLLQRGGDNEVLQRRSVTIPANGESVQVELQHTPRTEGTVEYVVRVPVLEGETNPQNNQLSRLVTVRKDKLRVLLADNRPRWSFRTLKALLEREPTVELHTALQDADPEFAQQDATARPVQGRIPSDPERLSGYHVIVLGDVNLEFVSPSVQSGLVQFVRRGGGVVFVAGRTFDPWTYFDTPLAELLPFDSDAIERLQRDVDDAAAWSAEPTPAGRAGTTLFRFGRDELEGRMAFRQLPGFYWLHTVRRTRPGAVALLQARSPDASTVTPVILLMRLGRGRVLYHATDELWRWRRPARLAAFEKYWIQALRLVGRLGGAEDEWELSTNRQVFALGESVRIRLKVAGSRTLAEGAEVVVETPEGREQTVVLSPLPTAPGILEGTMRPERPGRYHVRLTGLEGPPRPLATDFRVEAGDVEMRRRAIDEADLRTAAEISRGRYYSVAQLDQLAEDLPPSRPIPLGLVARRPLWNRWEWLLPLVGLLSVEWVVRRRRRLP